MLRVTLDTNILVSSTFWEGASYELLQLIEHKKIQCFLSKGILAEYYKTLHCKEIADKVEDHDLKAKYTIIKLIEMCSIVEPETKILAIKEDPDDNKILECAIEAKADYIITYDRHILKLKEFSGIRIVSPSEFLKSFL